MATIKEKANSAFLTLVTVTTVIVLVFGVGYLMLLPYTSVESVTVVITDKERVVVREGGETSSKYLIYTENETFENTDCWSHWKFNSSDLYGKLREGQEYRLKVYGWRSPMMSWYRNIVEIEE